MAAAHRRGPAVRGVLAGGGPVRRTGCGGGFRPAAVGDGAITSCVWPWCPTWSQPTLGTRLQQKPGRHRRSAELVRQAWRRQDPPGTQRDGARRTPRKRGPAPGVERARPVPRAEPRSLSSGGDRQVTVSRVASVTPCSPRSGLRRRPRRSARRRRYQRRDRGRRTSPPVRSRTSDRASGDKDGRRRSVTGSATEIASVAGAPRARVASGVQGGGCCPDADVGRAPGRRRRGGHVGRSWRRALRRGRPAGGYAGQRPSGGSCRRTSGARAPATASPRWPPGEPRNPRSPCR